MSPSNREIFRPEQEVLTPEVRRLQPADLFQIHEILYANLSEAYHAQFPEQDPDLCLKEIAEYEKNMAETFTHNERTYLVAELDGRVVGMLGCIHDSQRMRERLVSYLGLNQQENTPHEVAELKNFYVEPEMQNRGIGRKLWDGIRMTLAVGGPPRFVTLSSRDTWINAHAFYLNQGFSAFETGMYYGFPTTHFFRSGINF